jgi:hypothetical protein
MLGVVNFLVFYAGWFACVGGAATGWTLLGPAVAMLLVSVHLGVVQQRVREAGLIAAVGAVGWLVETLHVAGGAIRYGPSALWVWAVPGWMVALWVIFATTLTTSMRWLARRYALAAVLGAVCGPLSYYYGLRLGAVAMPDVTYSMVFFATTWAATLPLVLLIADRLPRLRPECPVPATSSA